MTRGLLVIPAYCEAARWPAFGDRLLSGLEARGGAWQLLLVDDGSPDEQAEALAAWIESRRPTRTWLLPLIRLKRNLGKGAAVLAGWDAARGDVEWLGFCDADGSMDAAEVLRLIDSLAATPGLVIASRAIAGGGRIGGSFVRRWLSRLFARCVRLSTGLPQADTQCGAKFIRADVYRSIRPHLRIRRFAFDVELIARAVRAGAVVAEKPVSWRHQPGGSLRPSSDGLRMLVDVLVLAVRLRLGR